MARRLPELDLLRGVAVLLVIGHHARPIPGEYPALFRVPMEAWQRCGWIGVDLFFVLSGFLVSGLLFREWQRDGRFRVLRFLGRRGFKIYPAFFVMWGMTLVWSSMRGIEWQNHEPLFEALFIQNYFPAMWGHTWSLAVEEHFYLSLPLLLLVLAGRRTAAAHPFKPIVWVWICAAVLSIALRTAIHHTRGFNLLWTYQTHIRAEELLFGVALSVLYHFEPERLKHLWQRHGRIIPWVGMALIAPSLFLREDHWFMHTLGFTTVAVGSGLLLISLLEWRSSKKSTVLRVLSPLAWIGFYSYSIYLWHLPVKEWFIHLNLVALYQNTMGSEMPWTLEFLAFVVISVLFGAGIARAVEIPVLALRDRVLPSRSGEIHSPS